MVRLLDVFHVLRVALLAKPARDLAVVGRLLAQCQDDEVQVLLGDGMDPRGGTWRCPVVR